MNSKIVAKAIQVEIIDLEITKNGIERYQPSQFIRCTINDHSYIGHIVNNKMHGEGRCEYFNGNIYEGYFLKGLKHGPGILTFSDGTKIEGIFKENQTSGHCKQFYPNGKLQYIGNMEFNKFHGSGTYYSQNGLILTGTWVNGIREGKFKYYTQSSPYYATTRFENGKIKNKCIIC